MMRATFALISCFLAGCGLDDTDKNACAGADDCVDGFRCDLSTNICVADDGEPVADWDTALADFIDALCSLEQACFPGDPPEPISRCIDEITTDMADARAALDPAGEEACIACMEAKADAATEVEAMSCNEAGVDLHPMLEACDLDHGADFDGDGVGDNDDDEACAGYP